MIDRETLQSLKEAAAAYPFVEDNWEYTRDHKIKSIRYEGRKYFPLQRNLKRAIRHIFPVLARNTWRRRLSDYSFWKPKFRMAWYALTYTDRSLPDGSLCNSIITHWEEDGEFIEAFPPSVVKELIELAEVGLNQLEHEQEVRDRNAEVLDEEARIAYDRIQAQHREEDRA